METTIMGLYIDDYIMNPDSGDLIAYTLLPVNLQGSNELHHLEAAMRFGV